MLKIYAVLTSHNRRELTLECLKRLAQSAKLADVNLNALAAWYLFGEALSPQKVFGIFVIVFGAFLVARS